MVGTLDGVSIRHVVSHVVEVCSREQDHALLLLHQMAAKTVVFLGQAQNQGTAVPHHAQVSVQNYIIINYAQYMLSALPVQHYKFTIKFYN